MSGLILMSRIVTLHDIKIKPDTKDAYDVLSFELTAKTFRYLDDAEVAAEKGKAAPSGKGKKGKKEKAQAASIG